MAGHAAPVAWVAGPETLNELQPWAASSPPIIPALPRAASGLLVIRQMPTQPARQASPGSEVPAPAPPDSFLPHRVGHARGGQAARPCPRLRQIERADDRFIGQPCLA